MIWFNFIMSLTCKLYKYQYWILVFYRELSQKTEVSISKNHFFPHFPMLLLVWAVGVALVTFFTFEPVDVEVDFAFEPVDVDVDLALVLLVLWGLVTVLTGAPFPVLWLFPVDLFVEGYSFFSSTTFLIDCFWASFAFLISSIFAFASSSWKTSSKCVFFSKISGTFSFFVKRYTILNSLWGGIISLNSGNLTRYGSKNL